MQHRKMIYMLAFVIFAMTTSEFMVAGMMNELAEEFDVSVSAVGYLISAYAAAMVVGGPVLTFALIHKPKRRLLMLLALLFLCGQAVGALAWNYEVMLIARIVTGIASASALGTAVSLSASLVRPNERGKSASIVLSGLMLATVAGLPGTTWIAQLWGWRASFWSVALMVAVACILLLRMLPAQVEEERTAKFSSEFARFRSFPLWSAYLTSMLMIGGAFAAFSYFVPILTSVTGLADPLIPLVLVWYGAMTIIGNWVVGRLADSYMYKVLCAGFVMLLASLVLFAVGAANPAYAIIAVTVIGLTGVSMNPAMVARVMRAGGSGTMVNTVHTSFITLGILIGSSLGGIGISRGYGNLSPLWIGAGLAGIGLLSLIPYTRQRSRHIGIDSRIE